MIQSDGTSLRLGKRGRRKERKDGGESNSESVGNHQTSRSELGR